jgi:holo-[acyl-carrier protein] synthase
MEREAVIQLISRVSRRKPEDIGDQVSLGSLGISSSLGLSLLRSRLEVVCGRALGTLDARMTVGETLTRVATDSEPSVDVTAPISPHRPSASTTTAISEGAQLGDGSVGALGSRVGLGLDIQDVDEMPLTNDFRSHEFYRDHFQPTEIATALLKPEPRLHLCGVFCAKEAAKKSHPELLELRMSAFTISHDANGRPLMSIADGAIGKRFRFILTISHSARFAAAACLTLWS